MKPARRLRFGWIDVAVLACFSVAIAYVAYRVDTVLHYRWDWAQVWPYILRVDPATGGWSAGLLLKGLAATVRLAVWGIALAAIFGLIFGLARVSRRLFPRLVARSYVELVRNIPPLVFMFIFYFFLSSQIVPLLGLEAFVREASPRTLSVLSALFGDPRLLANFATGVLCLALFEGAYLTEIVRAGIQSVEKGQWEAAAGLGLKRWQILATVVLPQALRRTLPPLAGQFIMLIKTSSIVSLISVQELTFIATEIAVTSSRVFEIWIVVAGFYFAISYALSLAFGRLERQAMIAGR